MGNKKMMTEKLKSTDQLDFIEIYCKDSFFFNKVSIKEFVLKIIKIGFWDLKKLQDLLGFEQDIDSVLTEDKRKAILNYLNEKL